MPDAVSLIAMREFSSEKRKIAVIVLAIATGVITYIIMDSMLVGWEDDIQSKTIDVWTSYMKILPPEDEPYITNVSYKVEMVENLPTVTGAAARLAFSGFIASPTKEKTALIMAIQPSQEITATKVYEKMVEGSYLNDGDRGKVVLGYRLAHELEVSTGQQVTLIFPNGEKKHFVIKGLFDSGFYEFDNTFALIHYDTAEEILARRNVATEIVVRVHIDGDLEEAVTSIKAITPQDRVVTWKELASYLLSILKVKSVGAFFLTFLILLTAAFAMTNSMIMKVQDRARYIGIMKAIGGKERFILKVYLLEAALVAIAGVAVGEAVSFLSILYLQNHPLVFPGTEEMVGTAVFPFRFHPAAFLYALLFCVFMCIIASLYPSLKASRLDPVEAMRHG
jgi:lipoprotein-releasing system permease protein